MIWISIIIILILVVLSLGVNIGLKETVMSKRKESRQMLEELWSRFGTDYRNYQNIPVEEVIIKSYDGLKLKGYFHRVYKDSKKVVIMNHGYTANHYIDYQFTDIFFEEGYNVLLIDMRSHGESEGKVASYGYNESKDIGSWVRWIKDKIGEDAYIGLHGQSMGAATVMLYGATHPNDIKFIIEDCGFTSAREAIKFQFRKVKIPFWPLYDLIRVKVKRKYKFDFNNISPKDAIVNSDIPVLFIHGDNDKVVPTWMGKALYNEKNGEMDRLYLVQGAGHMEAYSKDKEKYKQVVKEFLDNIK
ncbi:alpha/beta hydrolase [Clostridium sp. NSJ-145]|uniref:alpha/beta hydrolase n=1 Tax=Clostridium sp. NSJ-145 TaxID=2897777 RepID=UPI001E58D647|nr:alpha/beta hydrolase [Clostridium sp. NSJ-145]MCD2500854.1 alpha/beta hydrolase [Clostridium sp. NSJ-145]